MEKRELSHCWWECKLNEPLWKTVWRILKKKKKEKSYHTTQQCHCWAYTHRKQELKKTYTLVFTAALFTIARTWKQSRCPSTDEWIRKLWYIHTMDYYSAIKKSVLIWVSSNEMDEPRVYYTEWEKSERKNLILYINTYIWNLER